MITLCVPTITRYDLLCILIKSAERGTLVPDKYVIIDNGAHLASREGFAKQVEKDKSLPKDKITVLKRRYSVAKSWNYFIDNCEENIIISNDDIELLPNSIESIVNAANSHPDKLMFSAAEGGINAFSFFLIRKKLKDTIGGFDELFDPAYFEDCDFHRRMYLAGIERMNVIGLQLIHHHSATIKSFDREQRKKFSKFFYKNMDRYLRKWGGMPEKEAYEKPFNL